MNIMAVLLNGIAQLEYDRDKSLTDYQETYLNSLDEKMDSEGIEIDGTRINNPDMNQKIQFVTANMIAAMNAGNEGLTSALCTYIAARLPDLKQIKINDDNGDVTVDMVFDEDYKGQAHVTFGLH